MRHVEIGCKLPPQRVLKSIQAHAFRHCFCLKQIVLPQQLAYLQEGAFQGRGNLRRLVSNKTSLDKQHVDSNSRPPNLNNIPPSLFEGCYSLLELRWRPQWQAIPSGCFFAAGLERVRLPSSLAQEEVAAFAHCDRLTSVNMEDTVI